ncbi:MAG TPA: sigma-70 family RNA polymerase sigma factor [Phycisphaerae bacterium]|nr:sigma-70 family RNA polymerase sigma factor [Phycisphaerae bacterium]
MASRAASRGSLTDPELIGQVLAGDSAAFGEIVERHEDRLYNTIYRLVGSAEDARDLLQDTFVKAYEKLEAFRGGSSLYTWLFRIAVNTSLSHRRRRKWVQMSAPAGDDDDPNPGNAVADTAVADPADPLMAAETETLVQEAINSLDDEHRTVVVLRDIQHCDYQQIAEILEVPPGTVKSRLHRARMMLKDRLEPLLKG